MNRVNSKITRIGGAIVLAMLAITPAGRGASAAEAQAGDIRVLDPHIYMLPGTARSAPIVMTVVNDGLVPDRLIGVRTERSKKSGLMDMVKHHHLMRMVPIDAFEIPANQRIKLDAMGKHVMLMDIVEPLRLGETFTLVLEFARAGSLEVDVAVVPSAMVSETASGDEALAE